MAMSGYTKLFNSILASTIWLEPDHVRIVWITLLAMADKNGVADGSVPGLAGFAHVSVADCRDALLRLESPDEDSRSQEFGGRRIMPVDGGWQLLNHAKYRAKLNDDDRREYLRQKQSEYRKRKTSEDSASTNVTKVSDQYTVSTQAEAEAEAEAKAEATPTPTSAPSALRGGVVISPSDYFRLQLHNAHVGARLRVPHKLHGDFVAALGGEEPDAKLRGWYASLDAEIEASGEPITPNVWKWLDNRFKSWSTDQAGDAEMAKFLAGGA